MGVTFSAIVMAATAAAGAASTYAAYNQNKFQQKLANRNASKAIEDAAARETLQRRSSRRQIAAARAKYGAAGVALTGSPLSVLGDLSSQAEEQALLTRYGGDVTSAQDKARAESAGAAATASIISGTAQTLGGAAQQNQQNQQTYGDKWPGFS